MKYVLYKGLYLQKSSKAREFYDNQKVQRAGQTFKEAKMTNYKVKRRLAYTICIVIFVVAIAMNYVVGCILAVGIILAWAIKTITMEGT